MRRDLTIDILSPLKELHFEIPNGGFNLWVTLPDSRSLYLITKSK